MIKSPVKKLRVRRVRSAGSVLPSDTPRRSDAPVFMSAPAPSAWRSAQGLEPDEADPAV